MAFIHAYDLQVKREACARAQYSGYEHPLVRHSQCKQGTYHAGTLQYTSS